MMFFYDENKIISKDEERIIENSYLSGAFGISINDNEAVAVEKLSRRGLITLRGRTRDRFGIFVQITDLGRNFYELFNSIRARRSVA